VKKGGLVCPDCGKDVIDGICLNQSTLYSMQYIETSTIEKLYTFNVTEKVLTELGNVMSRMTDIYVGKHFKSLEILETLI
jgi:DNA repair protein RecO (recombination protein O)